MRGRRMEGEEIEGIRQKKLKERLAKMRRQEEYDAQVRIVLRKLLEQDAYERMSNVRLSNPELYFSAAAAIARAAGAGQIEGKITDEKLKEILAMMLNRHEPTLKIWKK